MISHPSGCLTSPVRNDRAELSFSQLAKTHLLPPAGVSSCLRSAGSNSLELDFNLQQGIPSCRSIPNELGGSVKIALEILFALMILFVLWKVGRATFPRM